VVPAADPFVLKVVMAGCVPERIFKKLWENIKNIIGLRLSEKISKGFCSLVAYGALLREPAWIMIIGYPFAANSRKALSFLPEGGYQSIAAMVLLKWYRLRRY
jgi:hypothetical protein